MDRREADKHPLESLAELGIVEEHRDGKYSLVRYPTGMPVDILCGAHPSHHVAIIRQLCEERDSLQRRLDGLV